MARSGYLYAILVDDQIQGLWTVKHEMARWLRLKGLGCWDIDDVDMRRYQNGTHVYHPYSRSDIQAMLDA